MMLRCLIDRFDTPSTPVPSPGDAAVAITVNWARAANPYLCTDNPG